MFQWVDLHCNLKTWRVLWRNRGINADLLNIARKRFPSRFQFFRLCFHCFMKRSYFRVVLIN